MIEKLWHASPIELGKKFKILRPTDDCDPTQITNDFRDTDAISWKRQLIGYFCPCSKPKLLWKKQIVSSVIESTCRITALHWSHPATYKLMKAIDEIYAHKKELIDADELNRFLHIINIYHDQIHYLVMIELLIIYPVMVYLILSVYVSKRERNWSNDTFVNIMYCVPLAWSLVSIVCREGV